MMVDATSELTVETSLGLVTPSRVIVSPQGVVALLARSEQIAIRHITDVQTQRWRAGIAGVVCVVLAAAALFQALSAGTIAVGMLLLSFGTLALWGFPSVVISTVDGKTHRAIAGFFDSDDAARFAEAIRLEMFREDWSSPYTASERRFFRPDTT